MADIQSLLGEEYREGMTIEEINTALEKREFVDPTTLPKTVEKSVFDKTASELSKVKKELADLKNANMTGEDKLNAALEAANTKEKEFNVKLNRLEVERLFVAEGLAEKDYASIIDEIVSEDLEKSTTLANNLLTVVKNQKIATEKALKAEFLNNTPKTPPQSNNTKTMTIAEFRKMTPAERYRFSIEKPEEYKKLYGGK